MIGFGFSNPFPLSLGGPESVEEIELEALLDAYAPGWDRSEGTANYAECQAYAQLLAMVWAANERLGNQAIPERMLEQLTDWETILKLRPSASTVDVNRRKAVAAAIRGAAGNTLTDLNDACTKLLGSNYNGFVFPATASIITYWPGVNPGPPGFEWSSTRLRPSIKLNKTGLSENDFEDKRAALARLLDTLLPCWMTFNIGVGSSFVVNQGIVGQTFL